MLHSRPQSNPVTVNIRTQDLPVSRLAFYPSKAFSCHSPYPSSSSILTEMGAGQRYTVTIFFQLHNGRHRTDEQAGQVEAS